MQVKELAEKLRVAEEEYWLNPGDDKRFEVLARVALEYVEERKKTGAKLTTWPNLKPKDNKEPK